MQDCSLLAADESQCLQGITVVTTVKLIIVKTINISVNRLLCESFINTEH